MATVFRAHVANSAFVIGAKMVLLDRFKYTAALDAIEREEVTI